MQDSSERTTTTSPVWNWEEKPEDREPPPSIGSLLMRCCVMYAIAACLWHFHGPVGAAVVGGLATLFLISGTLSPAARTLQERLGQFLAVVVGTVLAYVLLVPFFFLCFVPGRILLLITGKDPLCRARKTNAPSYWLDKPKRESDDRYERMF